MTAQHLIVVGVDGSEGGRRALQWALQESQARGSALRAVIAWSWDGIDFAPAKATSPREAREHAARVLEREVEQATARYGSSLPVTTEVAEGRPADVLATAGRVGNLLVLGSHGHGRVRHTVLGSVSEECIRKAGCPVVVVPVPVERPAADGRHASGAHR